MQYDSIHLTIDIVDTVGVIETWPYDDAEAYVIEGDPARAEVLDPFDPSLRHVLALVGPEEYN